MDDIKLYKLAVALEQDATWDSGGGCVGVMVTKGDHEIFFGFADGYLGWDWYQISKAEDQFLLVGSGVAEDMTEDLDIATLAARCRLVLSEL